MGSEHLAEFPSRPIASTALVANAVRAAVVVNKVAVNVAAVASVVVVNAVNRMTTVC